jgi:cobalamin biosynthesis protein CbiD
VFWVGIGIVVSEGIENGRSPAAIAPWPPRHISDNMNKMKTKVVVIYGTVVAGSKKRWNSSRKLQLLTN